MRNIKPLFYLYQIYKYIIFIPFFGISTFIFGLSGALFAVLINARIGGYPPSFWGIINTIMVPMFIKVVGKENVEKNQSYIFAANHLSLVDIFIIYGWLPADFRWVMKIELRKVPVLGYSCYKLGHIFVDRSNHEAAIASVNSAKEKIKNGTSIMFFAEGRRSDDGKLLDLKKGAFRFAIDIGLPIIPVTIVGTHKVLPNNTMALFPGKAKLIIHKPVETKDYNNDNINELMTVVKKSIQKGLDDYR